jgi:TolA-binding protein
MPGATFEVRWGRFARSLRGNKVADALIKEGDCLEKLGDKESARDRYSEVMRRFPDSGAAVMAEDRLSGLD